MDGGRGWQPDDKWGGTLCEESWRTWQLGGRAERPTLTLLMRGKEQADLLSAGGDGAAWTHRHSHGSMAWRAGPATHAGLPKAEVPVPELCSYHGPSPPLGGPALRGQAFSVLGPWAVVWGIRAP